MHDKKLIAGHSLYSAMNFPGAMYKALYSCHTIRKTDWAYLNHANVKGSDNGGKRNCLNLHNAVE